MANSEITISPEVWKDIPGFTGYEISNHGHVKSWRHKNGKRKLPFLKTPTKNKYGYLRIKLCDGNKVFNMSIHTLVLSTFIGPCPEGQQCRHLDGNTLNNYITNLCWGTAKDNALDRTNHGNTLIGEKNPQAKLKDSDVLAIRNLYAQGISRKKIGIMYNVNKLTVTKIVRHELWKHI